MTGAALPPVASAAPRRQVAAWALWDWGSAAFNAVMVTFVFGTYLASDAFGPDERGTAWLSTAMAVAGVVIAVGYVHKYLDVVPREVVNGLRR